MQTFKLFLVAVVAVCIFSSFTFSNPIPEEQELKKVEDDITKINEKVKGNFFEGDIVVGNTRNAVLDSTRIWTTPIHYSISEEYGWRDTDTIEGAIREYSVRTCISFTPKTDTSTVFMTVNRQSGCWSGVGMPTSGMQEVSIGVNCEGGATVRHEIMHCLGFWHEQSRYDRDNYVTINWENIPEANQHNFNKYDNKTVTTLDLDYDYVSIMHYKNNAFSSNGQPTIERIDNPSEPVGYQSGFTNLDIKKLNKLYSCSMTYDNEGYTQWSEWSACNTECKRSRTKWCDGEVCGDKGSNIKDTQDCPSSENCVVGTNPDCDVRFINMDGAITSPMFPYPYSNSMACSQTISVDEGKTITVKFQKMDIERVYDSCPYDALRIYDGASTSASLITTLCQSSTPDDIVSTGNSLTFKLTTDGSVFKHGYLAYYYPSDELPLLICTFEDGTCGWDLHTGDQIWTLKSGGTPSAGTGPSFDHTLDSWTQDSTAGNYIFLESSHPASSGQKAKATTPRVNGTTGGECLTFWYHMYGERMGTLRVHMTPIDSITASSILWKASGDHQDEWKMQQIPIQHDQNESYKIMFEMERGSSWTSDGAIDDITITSGTC